MVEIQIPFNTWSIGRLSAGKKRATSRTKQYGKPRDTFSVVLTNGSTARYQLKFVVQLPLWQKIHPHKGWTGDEIVYYHYFEVCRGGVSG